ncbi:MAG: hypothetical protein ACTHN7_06420 [Solirubrobacterales bacterium]
MKGCVLHIGPGKLGLGLIVDLTLKAEIDTHVIGRPGSDAAVGRFSLILTGGERKPLNISSYSEAVNYDQLRDPAKDAAISSVSMLVTTSVGKLDGCMSLLNEIAEERNLHPGDTVFIACENDLGDSYEEIEKRLIDLEVDCRRAMVNRICPESILDNGELLVRGDPHAEWLIEGIPDTEVLAQLDQLQEVQFVEDVEPFAVRKRWVVNGGHLALGLFGRKDKVTSVAVVARDEARQAQLIDIQKAMIQALPEEWVELLGDSAAYAHGELLPMCRTEDEVPRILHRLKRENLAPFIESAEKRLGEPAKRFRKTRQHLSPHLESVFEVMQDVLLDLESYVDALAVRAGKVKLDADRDEEAVAAYRELLDGVFSKEKSIRWSDRLQRELARHRIAYG